MYSIEGPKRIARRRPSRTVSVNSFSYTGSPGRGYVFFANEPYFLHYTGDSRFCHLVANMQYPTSMGRHNIGGDYEVGDGNRLEKILREMLIPEIAVEKIDNRRLDCNERSDLFTTITEFFDKGKEIFGGFYGYDCKYPNGQGTEDEHTSLVFGPKCTIVQFHTPPNEPPEKGIIGGYFVRIYNPVSKDWVRQFILEGIHIAINFTGGSGGDSLK